jgi:hypothetical protein
VGEHEVEVQKYRLALSEGFEVGASPRKWDLAGKKGAPLSGYTIHVKDSFPKMTVFGLSDDLRSVSDAF